MSRLSLNLICGIIWWACGYTFICVSADKKSFVNLEYPVVTYLNKKYLADFKVTLRRLSRKDPIHYLSLIYKTLFYGDNNTTFTFSIYEFVSNVYRPTFIELRYKWCDLVERDPFIGQAFRNAFAIMSPGDAPKTSYKCPHPPGVYRFNNMSFPQDKMPEILAYKKGRVNLNLTYKQKDIITTLYLNYEIQEYHQHKKS